jgi:hypothetical protein
MSIILKLYTIWFVFWAYYNFVLLKKGFSTEKTPAPLAVMYFLSSLFSVLVSKSIISNYLVVYIIFFLALIIFAGFKKARFFGRLSNSIFQLTWLFSVYAVTGSNLPIIVVFFTVAHLPILFVKHLKPLSKVLILVQAFLGGVLLSEILINFSFPINLSLGIFTHLIFYLFLKPLDEKYRLNIVN